MEDGENTKTIRNAVIPVIRAALECKSNQNLVITQNLKMVERIVHVIPKSSAMEKMQEEKSNATWFPVQVLILYLKIINQMI